MRADADAYWKHSHFSLFSNSCHMLHHYNHPGVAENIAPVGGPGSHVIVEGIPPWDNSWVQDGSFYTLT